MSEIGVPRPKTGGRTTGTPNKATSAAREAIALFVDSNAPKLQQWLEDVANGVLMPGEVGKFAVNPNPAKAFELFQSIVEYHIPKLARTEHTGGDGGPVEMKATVTFVRPPKREVSYDDT
jgi:hypothetical protein